MIAKKFKVPRSELLRLKEFRLYKARDFVIRYKKSELSYNRYLVVVGRKVSASAVVRNQVKRMFYRIILASTFMFVGYDVVVYPNASVVNFTVEDVRSFLTAAFSNIFTNQ